MSRRRNCYDNAPIESFWGVLKNELVHHRRYETRQEAIRQITTYIEIFTIGSDGRRGLVMEALNKDLWLFLDSGRIRLCEVPRGADVALFRDFFSLPCLL